MVRKESKKDLLKKPDEFMVLSERAIYWAREHQGITLLAASCFVLIIVAVIIGKMVYSSYEEKKRLAFQEAANMAALPEKSAQAIGSFQAFLKKYGGSDLAPLARVSLGRLYFEQGQYDKAIEQYNEALSGLKERPEIKPLAVLASAFSYEAKGAIPKALEALLSIKDDPANYLQEEVLFQLARIYRHSGELDKAKAAGEELKKKFPGSPYLTLAAQ
jgi:TolA-binding protein